MVTSRVNNVNITKLNPGVLTNTAEVLQNKIKPIPESLTPVEPANNALTELSKKVPSRDNNPLPASKIRMAALPKTKEPPPKEENNTQEKLMQKAQSMPDLLAKYNINEVDPKLETEAEKKAKALIVDRLKLMQQ